MERTGRTSVFVNFSVILFALLWFLPTLGLFITSLREPAAVATSGWWQAFARPAEWTLSNYGRVLGSAGIGRALVNSLLISVPSTLFTLLIAALAAFPLAFHRFRGRLVIFGLFIALQAVPLQSTLIPVLRILKSLGLAGTFPGIWMAHTAYGLPFAVFLLRAFYAGIPVSLLDAARIDGASDHGILFRLVLPLSLPAFISLAVFQFLWVWNDLLISLVYLGGTPDVAPLTIKLRSLLGSLESGWHILAAAAFLSMVLPLAVFFALQRYFIKGILTGAVKE